jgi:DNA polymerase (family 10)
MVQKNAEIAKKLREQANALARAGGNLYRVRAFRSAAMAVLGLPVEVTELLATEGVRGLERELERIPGIGKSLAHTIAGYAQGEAASNDMAA